MEKLLSKRKLVINSSLDNTYTSLNQIFGWVFSGMVFSKNINGWTSWRPSIALTFSSNIRAIPDKLLPSRACFRLTRRHKFKTKFINCEIRSKKFVRQMIKCYFCQLILGLIFICKCIAGLFINVSTFFRTGQRKSLQVITRAMKLKFGLYWNKSRQEGEK